jgi:hypothetical protein
VFKQKAIEEALTLLKENGFEVPEPVAKNSKSRSDSVILFGEKAGSSSSSDSSNKKKDAKATGKEDDRMSMVSGKTSGSKYSKKVTCDLCGKVMRSDHLKAHRGSRHCQISKVR